MSAPAAAAYSRFDCAQQNRSPRCSSLRAPSLFDASEPLSHAFEALRNDVEYSLHLSALACDGDGCGPAQRLAGCKLQRVRTSLRAEALQGLPPPLLRPRYLLSIRRGPATDHLQRGREAC